LQRFGVVAEPSMEDETEKGLVFDALVDIGKDALPQIRRMLRSADSINWIQRTLRSIVSPEEYKKELLDMIEDFDTEYERNPDRKLQTIMALADIDGEDVTRAILRFLNDVDETVRYQTVVALTKQGQEIAREPLLKAMCEDESLRVRNEVVEAFSRLGWSTSGYKKKVDTILPSGFKHDKTGKIVKLGSS
jgi:HEAT repeat protein